MQPQPTQTSSNETVALLTVRPELTDSMQRLIGGELDALRASDGSGLVPELIESLELLDGAVSRGEGIEISAKAARGLRGAVLREIEDRAGAGIGGKSIDWRYLGDLAALGADLESTQGDKSC